MSVFKKMFVSLKKRVPLRKLSTKELVLTGMFCAIAYVFMALFRIPIISLPAFDLCYDPKDFIIVIGGFILGPVYAFIISFIVSFFEMITVSNTQLVGFFMNVVSTSAFVCTAAVIYKKKRTITGASIGLIAGCLVMTGMMLLWNYIITPGYQGVPRQVVTNMLIPVFLPFNLIKSSINAAITIIVYKPLVNALRKSGMIPRISLSSRNTALKSNNASLKINHAVTETNNINKINIGVLFIALFVLITCILVVLSIRGII